MLLFEDAQDLRDTFGGERSPPVAVEISEFTLIVAAAASQFAFAFARFSVSLLDTRFSAVGFGSQLSLGQRQARLCGKMVALGVKRAFDKPSTPCSGSTRRYLSGLKIIVDIQ